MDSRPSVQYEGAERAAAYSKYRPKIPKQVIDRIIAFLKQKYDGELKFAVDTGCGSGQCTDVLAPHFVQVLATDISEAQIHQAKSTAHPPNIEFRRSPAENIPVEDGSVQLVNASQAAHYFNLPVFFKEVDRVLCPNGIVALSANPKTDFDNHGDAIGKEISEAITKFYVDKLVPYSVAELDLCHRGYEDIIMPFTESVREEIKVDDTITLSDYANFVLSWCPYQNYCQVHDEAAGLQILNELVDTIRKVLQTHLPPDHVTLKMTRTYVLLMGRKA